MLAIQFLRMLQQIFNGLKAGNLDIATFITTSKLDYDDAYALLIPLKTKVEQSQNARHMFNANYANLPNYNNYHMMNAFYAQIRGNARKGGYTEGFQGNYSGHSGGKNGSMSGRHMFFSVCLRGFSSETSHFCNHGSGHMMIGNNMSALFTKGSFGALLLSNGNLSSIEP